MSQQCSKQTILEVQRDRKRKSQHDLAAVDGRKVQCDESKNSQRRSSDDRSDISATQVQAPDPSARSLSL